METLKAVGEILLGFIAIGTCLWLWMRFLGFLDARGLHLRLRRGDPRVEPSKVEVQSLFHGNTKDEEQI